MQLQILTSVSTVLRSLLLIMISWILASSSPRRQQLLKEFGLQFRCFSPVVDEIKRKTDVKAEQIPEINAQLKAEACAKQFPESYVIGADTVVLYQGSLFNKPSSFLEAKEMLKVLSGQTHEVITAVAIIKNETHFSHHFFEKTYVAFQRLSESFIDTYLQEIHPLDKAGAYAIQHPLTQTFATVKGSFSNVMGFPIEAFSHHCKKWGLPITNIA